MKRGWIQWISTGLIAIIIPLIVGAVSFGGNKEKVLANEKDIIELYKDVDTLEGKHDQILRELGEIRGDIRVLLERTNDGN
jgi:hypothetical protein